LDWSEFPVGRSRLDHCDVAEYEKIIFKNWSTFSDVFGRKDMLSQHMAGFREFRNSVAHNYMANDVQKKLGEAAFAQADGGLCFPAFLPDVYRSW
jgi:hypothetical protein